MSIGGHTSNLRTVAFEELLCIDCTLFLTCCMKYLLQQRKKERKGKKGREDGREEKCSYWWKIMSSVLDQLNMCCFQDLQEQIFSKQMEFQSRG